ncbi:hypothetical protein I5E68_00245 [Novosphingobium sp. YJ-S2-02]|uniref:Uncharacterized protein n=1 Tax=Novosphingobium aureum TaxID=2792964 RepID=A0A931H9A5_9SPHN|nr:hypothetical protein [Novosphingobium aureum]MBH0111378.1 hypothetical protein [Novosphingobium aureum]
MDKTGTASLTISEMREFASFDAGEQRYIRRSLDVGFERHDAAERWGRDAAEVASIKAQYGYYQDLRVLRGVRPDEYDLEDIDLFMGKLMRMAAFDLAQERLSSFSAFRFLYERLLGAWVRPWLPSAFCGAAALPQIRPERRKCLLHSISEAAATAPAWSEREPAFLPEWIEEDEAA